MSCKDDINNDMYDNVMQDTQQVLGASDDSRKSFKVGDSFCIDARFTVYMLNFGPYCAYCL